MSYATLVIGRDGMGPNATEEDFEAWVDYVRVHIGAASRVCVQVLTRSPLEPQNTMVGSIDEDDTSDMVNAAVQVLWDQWCRDGAPGVSHDG